MLSGPTIISYGVANPHRDKKPARKRSAWIAKFICRSRAQAIRLERFYKADSARLKAAGR